jgi:hypothetical protein
MRISRREQCVPYPKPLSLSLQKEMREEEAQLTPQVQACYIDDASLSSFAFTSPGSLLQDR